jgi:hypothetical protein
MSNELEDLKREVAKLKDQLNPPPRPPSTHRRYDPTEGMTMDRSAMKAMIDAVPSSLMSDLRADARRPNPVTGGPPQPQVRQRATPNWIEERPLESPPGIKIIDAMMNAQDAKDRAELIERELRLAKLSKGK